MMDSLAGMAAMTETGGSIQCKKKKKKEVLGTRIQAEFID